MAKDILSNLTPAKGSRRKTKRIGRGQGSGHGKTATKGHKGAKSRSGHKFKLWFEGGQMPLSRRVPKFGFKSRNRVLIQSVNVESLERVVTEKKLGGSVVNPEVMYSLGLISKKNDPVKILGNGDLKAKLEVSAHAFSKSALAKIEAAGGKATVLGHTKS
ncbi:MAG TPA: 50S ribosomal protein L15 [Bacteroidetes bacterium]|nr:MAG: 50S ribosomal protein L15 [Ignavibacteria bacterium GWA2_54_16]HCA81969.1 50S ribosomal protein L15 [Bacteroidota bacterium]